VTNVDQNMMTSSSLLPEIEHKEVEEVCNLHDVHLIEFANRVFCPECAKELTEQRSKEIVEKETEAYYLKEKRYIKQSIYSDGTLKKATFDSYMTDDKETAENKQKARLLAGSYLKGETFNVIFTGKVGTGKSHLAMSMLQAVNDHSNPFKKCLFVSVDELISLLRYSYSNKETMAENELRRLCVDADLLVLDDLGAEVGTITTDKSASNDTARLINAIVTGRMDKPTIFTTNLNSKQIHKMYDERIASRIFKGVNKDRIIKFTETKDKRNQIEF